MSRDFFTFVRGQGTEIRADCVIVWRPVRSEGAVDDEALRFSVKSLNRQSERAAIRCDGVVNDQCEHGDSDLFLVSSSVRTPTLHSYYREILGPFYLVVEIRSCHIEAFWQCTGLAVHGFNRRLSERTR